MYTGYKVLSDKPWYLDLTPDAHSIHESWFPGQNRSGVSGDYFALYPSLPQGGHHGYVLSGQQYPLDAFCKVTGYCGTGASLQVYTRT